MSIEILDPTHEADADVAKLATRLGSLSGKSVGFISNGKQGTGRFFDALEKELNELGVARVVRLTKGNYSAPAPADVMAQAAQCDAIVAGIGD